MFESSSFMFTGIEGKHLINQSERQSRRLSVLAAADANARRNVRNDASSRWHSYKNRLCLPLRHNDRKVEPPQNQHGVNNHKLGTRRSRLRPPFEWQKTHTDKNTHLEPPPRNFGSARRWCVSARQGNNSGARRVGERVRVRSQTRRTRRHSSHLAAAAEWREGQRQSSKTSRLF